MTIILHKITYFGCITSVSSHLYIKLSNNTTSLSFLIKTSLLTFSGVRRFLKLLATLPALLKIHLEGMLVPQIQRYFLAK